MSERVRDAGDARGRPGGLGVPPAERLARPALIRVWLALAGAFVLLGALRATLGPALLPLAERIGASAAALSGLGSVQALGATLIVLTSGPLLPRLGQRRLLLAAFLLMAVGAFGFGFGATLLLLGAGALGIGLGTGAVELGGNTLVGRLYGERSAGPLNLVSALFGVGAIAGPALLAALEGRVGAAFGAMALLAALLLPTLLGVRIPGGEGTGGARAGADRSAEAKGGAEDVAGAPTDDEIGDEIGDGGERGVEREGGAPARPPFAWGTLAGIAAVFFLYVGIEASVGTLLAIHLEASRGAAFATLATSFFWGALMVGRFAASAFADRVAPRALVTGALALGGAALLATAWTPLAPAAYVLAGLLLAPVFPTGLSALLRAFPGRSGIATSTVLVSASSGAVVLIGLNGWLIERGSVATLPWQYAAIGAPAIVLAWVFLGRAERLEPRR